jgi:Domain of unknown function (DUF4352)
MRTVPGTVSDGRGRSRGLTVSGKTRSVLAALFVVVAAGAVIASGDDNKAAKVDSSGSTTPGGAAASYTIGDEVKLGDWTVKVWGKTDPQPQVNEFSKPKAGSRWVTLDTEVKNLSTDPEAVSSLLCFKLQDSLNREYTIDIVSGVDPGPPDGEVAPAGAKRGNLVFEVPADATGLKLNFKCDLLSSGTATVNL